MLRRDFAYKLVAIVTALTLWAYVQDDQNPKITRNSPGVALQVRGLATGYVMTSGTAEVAVVLEGTKSLIDAVDRGKLSAWVDLAGRGPGTYTVPVQVELPKKASSELRANAVPSSVTMTLEAVSSRVMAVDVNYVTPPPLGYDLGQPKITPASAYISGRSAIVERVRRLAVMVDPSNITSPGGNVDGYFSIAALDASGNEVKGVTIDPGRTRVRLSMELIPATKMVIVSPTFSGQPRFGHVVTKVNVRPGEITIKGRPEALRNISTVSTDEIDVEGATASIVKDVALRLPAGVEAEHAKTVHVTVRIEETGGRVEPL